jgi:hypothetical protein
MHMHGPNLRSWFIAVACGLAIVAGTAGTTLAQPTNDQAGLINVNLQDLALQIPVAAAVPIGVAANVCNLSVIEVEELGDTGCTAENNSTALSFAFADAILGTGGGGGNGGGPSNEQAGLVNVNVQEVIVQVPVSLAVPIGVAANVCNVSVIELQETGATECDAQNTSNALSAALARAIIQEN